jgi:hypothetical protein
MTEDTKLGLALFILYCFLVALVSYLIYLYITDYKEAQPDCVVVSVVVKANGDRMSAMECM